MIATPPCGSSRCAGVSVSALEVPAAIEPTINRPSVSRLNTQSDARSSRCASVSRTKGRAAS